MQLVFVFDKFIFFFYFAGALVARFFCIVELVICSCFWYTFLIGVCLYYDDDPVRVV